MLRSFALAACASLLFACSGSDDASPTTTPTDDVGVDGGATDGGSDVALEETSTADATPDAMEDAMEDAAADATEDASSDASTDAVATDASSDAPGDAPADGGACHDGTLGAPAVPIAKVSSLPTMTGGTIVPGIYDATAAKTTGSVTGTYRATWDIGATTIDAIEQLTLSGSPPVPTPRTLSWSTSGTTLTRTQICGGSTTFSNQFTVRTEGGTTYLDVRQDVVMFTFTKR